MALGLEWQQKLEEQCLLTEEKKVAKFYRLSFWV
jgi:hypothetical protein